MVWILTQCQIFKVFGSNCYILEDNKNGKLDAKSEEGIFLSYSTKSKTYTCLNANTNKVVESANGLMTTLG